MLDIANSMMFILRANILLMPPICLPLENGRFPPFHHLRRSSSPTCFISILLFWVKRRLQIALVWIINCDCMKILRPPTNVNVARSISKWINLFIWIEGNGCNNNKKNTLSDNKTERNLTNRSRREKERRKIELVCFVSSSVCRFICADLVSEFAQNHNDENYYIVLWNNTCAIVTQRRRRQPLWKHQTELSNSTSLHFVVCLSATYIIHTNCIHVCAYRYLAPSLSYLNSLFLLIWQSKWNTRLFFFCTSP